MAINLNIPTLSILNGNMSYTHYAEIDSGVKIMTNKFINSILINVLVMQNL